MTRGNTWSSRRALKPLKLNLYSEIQILQLGAPEQSDWALLPDKVPQISSNTYPSKQD
jgi:hypothetical protein